MAVLGRADRGSNVCPWVNSGLAAFLALLFFASGLFHAKRETAWYDRRTTALEIYCTGNLALFFLVYLRVLPDASFSPVYQRGAVFAEIVVLHLLVPTVYVAAYFAGVQIDRRFDSLQNRFGWPLSRRLASNCCSQIRGPKSRAFSLMTA